MLRCSGQNANQKLGRTKCQPQKKVRTKCQPLVGIMSGWHFVRLAFCPTTPGGGLVQLGCRCRAIILFVPSAVGILIPLQTCYLCLFKHIFSLGISHRASFLEKFEFGASYYSVKQQQLKFCETLIVFRELRCEYPKVVRRPPDF